MQKLKPFIVFDGIECVGKTEISQEIAKRVGGIYFKSPKNMPEDIKNIVKGLDINPLLRYSYYKKANIKDSKEIKETSKESLIVGDRYISSSVAFHNALGLNIDYNEACRGLLKPNLTLLLITEEEERLNRLAQRKSLTDTDKDLMLAQRAQQNFLLQGHPVFDTTHTTVEQAASQILDRFGQIFNRA